MHHMVYNDIVQDQRRNFCRVQSCWDRNKLLSIPIYVLGIGSIRRQSCNEISNGNVGNAFANRVHSADKGIVTRFIVQYDTGFDRAD